MKWFFFHIKDGFIFCYRMNIFTFAVLTCLVSVACCSVTWNNLKRFLEEAQIDKRETILWDDGTSPMTCPEGKGLTSNKQINNIPDLQCMNSELFLTGNYAFPKKHCSFVFIIIQLLVPYTCLQTVCSG